MDILFKKNTAGQLYKVETLLNNKEKVDLDDGQLQAWIIVNGDPELDTSLDVE